MTTFGLEGQQIKFRSDAILDLARELKQDEKTFLMINKDYKKRTLERTTWASVLSSFNVVNEYVGDFAPYLLGSYEIILKNSPFNKNIYGKWVVDKNDTSKKIEVGFPTFTARTIYKPEYVKVCGNLVSFSNRHGDYDDLLGLLYQYLYFYRTCYDKKKAKEIFEDLNLNEVIYDINDFLHASYLFEQDNISNSDYIAYVDKIRTRLISLETSLQLIDKINNGKINPVKMVREIEQLSAYPKRAELFIVQNTVKLDEGNELKKVVKMRKNRF